MTLLNFLEDFFAEESVSLICFSTSWRFAARYDATLFLPNHLKKFNCPIVVDLVSVVISSCVTITLILFLLANGSIFLLLYADKFF